MKLRFFLTAFFIAAVTPLFAGGVFYNSNQSAEYFRTYERNAATDNADAVYYNMAGTTRMKDGIYVHGSNQMLFQEATVKTDENQVVGDKTYKSDNPVWLCPNLYVLYKQNNWSAFTGLETIGATAIREWEDGLPTLDSLSILNGGPGKSYVKGTSYYFAWRLGGAYAVNELFSIGACGRVVTSRQHVEGYIVGSGNDKIEMDYTDDALGYSGEIGFNVYPVKEMTISFTYEMATKLDFKRNINDGKSGVAAMNLIDGEKKRLDLPQALRFGISYNITEKFRTEFGVDAYLEKYVNFERLDDSAAGIDADKDYGNTYEEGLTFEYTFNKMFLASIGFNLTQIGQKKSATLDTSIPGAHADYWSAGIGGQVTPIEDLKINFGIGYTGFQKKYEHADYSDDLAAAFFGGSPSKEYNKQYIVVAIGAEYRFI